MGLVHRVMVVAVVLVCIGASALLVGWASKPNFSLLFSGLEPEEASQIVEKIRDADVPFELRAGGTTILVPEDKVYSLRLSLAGQGLVGSGHDSYRILDNQALGTSPGVQRINYIRAVQGELARTIRSLDGVAACRVHISNPERRMFNRDEDSPSASVAVKMKAGNRLSANNVSAIVHLVAAGAGGGLTSDNVVVVDGRGNVLSKGAATDDGGAADFAGQVSNIELVMARKVEQLVEGLVGPGRVRARVTVEMTRKKVETTTDESIKGAIVSETEKTMKTETPGTGGAPGSKTTESTLDSTSVPSTTRTVTTTLPGEITRKSVAVAVDLTPPKAEESEDGEPATPAKMPDLTTIEKQVTAALGLNIAPDDATEAVKAAADVLAVTETSMLHGSDTAGELEEAGLLSPGNLMEMLRQGSMGILVIGILLVLRMFGGGKSKSTATAALTATGAAGALEGAKVAEAAALLPGGEEGSPDALKASITRALHENPEEVKRLFLSWAGGERGEA